MDLLVGSQDATTCIVAVLACPNTTVVWVAHLDDLALGCQDMLELKRALQQMQEPQLYLAGGYCEESGRGPSKFTTVTAQLQPFWRWLVGRGGVNEKGLRENGE
jgi:hypothetical protein